MVSWTGSNPSFSLDTGSARDLVYVDEEGRVTVEWEELLENKPYDIDYKGQTYIIRRRDSAQPQIKRVLYMRFLAAVLLVGGLLARRPNLSEGEG